MESALKIKMLAKTFEGMEEVLARELLRMNAEDVKVERKSVSFTGNKKLLYRANYELRTALKILVPLVNFKYETIEDIYDNAKVYQWNKYLNIYKSFKVETNIKTNKFEKSEEISSSIEKAVNDYFAEKSKKTPPIDQENPSVIINAYVKDNQCIISLDSSGNSLSKRGYRVSSSFAPLNEVFAAGLVQLSGYRGEKTLIDPMCGSATILIEAAMYIFNIPSQICRDSFGFLTWRDFEQELWTEIKNEARQRIRPRNEFNHKLIGGDVSDLTIKNAIQNVRKLSLEKYIDLSKTSFENTVKPDGDCIVIINPPFGDRFKFEELQKLYSQIGTTLKKKYGGVNAWILGSNDKLIKYIGMQPSKTITLYNGPTECKFLLYDVYKLENMTKEFQKNV